MNGAQRVDGEREARSAITWSPTSNVLAIEREGMAKFWKTNVSTKRPTTRGPQSDAMD